VKLARDAQDFPDELRAAEGAQVADAGHDSQSDVDRVPRGHLGAREVRNSWTHQAWVRMLPWPPGAFAAAAPFRQVEGQLASHWI
jgi:hypothetical protein